MPLIYRFFISLPLVLLATAPSWGDNHVFRNTIDSTPTQRGIALAYYGPAIHPGLRVAYQIPFKERTFSISKSNSTLSNFLRIRHQFVIEPYITIYNHRFNHMGVSIGALAMEELRILNRFSLGLGGHIARIAYFYRDVVVYSNRSYSTKRVMSEGYNQIGLNAQVGIRFHHGGLSGMYYRPYLGLLVPFNHLFSAYLHHEVGIMLAIHK